MTSTLAAAIAMPATAALAEDASQAPASQEGDVRNLAGAREIPAKQLPVPQTVSETLKERIAAPYPPAWDRVPASDDDWRALAAQSAADVAPFLPGIKEGFGVEVEKSTIAGVDVFTITPAAMPDANADRLLLHIHGGGYVLYPGEAGAGEGMLMAGYGGFKVVSVDYRMAPDHRYPAALDDVMAVWAALAQEHDPARMGVFGSSAGGALTLALVLRAKAEGLPLPGAIAPGTPAVDALNMGDSIRANEFLDNMLVSKTGWAGGAIKLYAGDEDLQNPFISPIHGDFSGFPPAILTTGTRDLFLSNTALAHRKLRQAGVVAELHVYEAQSHAQYLDPTIPEAKEAFDEITAFFDRHLA